MKKKLALLLVLMMVLGAFTACGGTGGSGQSAEKPDYPENFQAFLDALDVNFSSEVNKTISEQGDDPVLGFRSAGSPAEKATADYIEKTMKQIGLENVTVDQTDLDGWTFKGANLTFTDAKGEAKKVDLGGYQTTIQAKNEKISLVYLGKGTAKDYKDVDVKDKLVLIDIDQNEEWWINTPAYQAHVNGAKAVLANSAMPVEMGDRIGTQDMCGPADAPALGISQDDTNAIKAAIKASGKKEIQVTFNADSKVTPDSHSQNVWGEIPGKTDEVIYMMAHMDGYFHSYFDDASGIGILMGTAKAMIDSGYKPEKTIRFICHGAEEWGRENSQADWAIGSFEQINTIHPEWAEKAFAIVNIDGAYCVEGETTFGIAVCEELYNYIDPIAQPMIKASPYKYRYMIPPSTYKEDFNYVQRGVPSVSTAKGEETIFYDKGYHTSADSREVMGFDDDAWLWMHTLYGRFVYAFDDTPVRPMDFTTRFEALKDSYDKSVVEDKELAKKIDAAIEAARPVTKAINKLNSDYAKAVSEEDTKTADSIKAQASDLNKELYTAYLQVQKTLLHLDQDLAIIFPHENRQSNILGLRAAIGSLEAGNGAESYEEHLSGVGNGWLAMFFDKETLDFQAKSFGPGLKDTWAEGIVDVDDCDVQDVVRSLMKKTEKKNTDYSHEIKVLKKLEGQQKKRLGKVIKEEKDGLDKLIKTLDELNI